MEWRERTLRRQRPFVLGLARLWLRRSLGLYLVGRGGRMLPRRDSRWSWSVSRACVLSCGKRSSRYRVEYTGSKSGGLTPRHLSLLSLLLALCLPSYCVRSGMLSSMWYFDCPGKQVVCDSEESGSMTRRGCETWNQQHIQVGSSG